MDHILTADELIQLVLATFEAERTHDTAAGISHLHDDFCITEMTYDDSDGAFARLQGDNMIHALRQAYQIKGREYVFKHVIADEKSQTVMIEFVESYPDPQSNQVYRTPQIAVCELKDGKLYRTRHYMDPRLSYENLSTEEIETAFL